MDSQDLSLRKAAILIAALDADTADLLLAQMPPEQVDAVRAQVLDLGNVDPAEQQTVIDAFCRIGPLVPEPDPPGLSIDDSLVAMLPPQAELAPDDSENEPAFEFLHRADPEAIVTLLEREHPQTIALVIAHLPPDRAGDVLAQLPSATQTEVLRRLVDLETTDSQTVREVEQALKRWWTGNQSQRRRSAGVAAVSAILNSADAAARRQILHNLASHDRQLASQIAPLHAPRRFTFAELCELDLDTLTRVVRAADPETATLALAGAATDLVDALLDRLWPDEARRITKGLTHLGPTRLTDIEHAQEELARLAGQMHAEGRLPALTVSHLTAIA